MPTSVQPWAANHWDSARVEKRLAGHADQRPALGGEPLGLGAGGEALPLDDDQRG
jgi:hypothetical protein